MDLDIRNDAQRRRFTTNVEGGEAFIAYRKGNNNIYELVATEVPVASRGQNIGDALVREALKTAKLEMAQVIATCPFVKRWFVKHPDEQAILAKPMEEASQQQHPHM